MARPSLYQTVTQSLLASALIFAVVIGYWGVGAFQTSSADATSAASTNNVNLGWTLIVALIGSLLVSLILLYRHFRSFGRAEAE